MRGCMWGGGGRGVQGCSSCFAACLGLCPVRSHFYRFLLRRRRRKRDEHFQLDAVADLEWEWVRWRGKEKGETALADLKFKVSKKLVNNYWFFLPTETL